MLQSDWCCNSLHEWSMCKLLDPSLVQWVWLRQTNVWWPGVDKAIEGEVKVVSNFNQLGKHHQ